MNKKICVIGASNVDLTGFTKHKLIYRDANIGTLKTSPGGVGRNIAENLARLGFDVNLISIFGDNPLSDYIIKSCRDLNLNIDDSLIIKNASAATFLAIMDENNDLALGLSDMAIYDKVEEDFIISKLPLIEAAGYVVLETNMPENILKLIVEKVPDKKYVLDTVSGKKALKALDILPALYILKTNLLEAQMLSNINVDDRDDLRKLVRYFLDRGVKNVFITLGKEGVVYGNSEVIEHQDPLPAKVVNTIGAGDSFVAGIIYADILGLDIHKIARYGMASATLTVQYDSAVSPDMNPGNIKKIFFDEA